VAKHLSRGTENQYSGRNRRRLYESIGLQIRWWPFASSPIRKHRYLGRSSKWTAGRATSSSSGKSQTKHAALAELVHSV